jgi:hypothetical protein
MIKSCLNDVQFSADWQEDLTANAGERLMEWVNFLGCSPNLYAGSLDCRIRIHYYKEKNALGGQSIDSIRYPKCKHRIDNTLKLLQLYPQHSSWTCPECGNQGFIEDINWRKSAGFSHYFIEVSNIFPKEAVPSPGMLQSLKTCTQQDWNWFYSKSSQF